MEKWLTYTNGNYCIKINTENGTKIRETEDDFFESEFPENIDIKISDRCDMGCQFCHENSTSNGNVSDLNLPFLDTLRAGTELAIGGGNIFENKDLSPFLHKCKSLGLIPNITVVQKHFIKHYEEIQSFIDKKLVYGVGVSYTGNAKELEGLLTDNCVIHLINGVHLYKDIKQLEGIAKKVLILGYKDLRRGTSYKNKNAYNILRNQKVLGNAIPILRSIFDVVSFDNLALEQLDIKNMVTEDEWKNFYMGDDGDFTMYIDAVKKEYALSSTSLERFPLENDIVDMFRNIKNTKEKHHVEMC